MLDIETIQKNIEKFLSDTEEARELSEKCRDYYDGRQWTDAEVRKLKARKQAPIVSNKIKPKVEGLVGLYDIRKSDPKAYPRTQKHSEAGHVVTDALRFVLDNNDFDTIRGDVAEDFFIEGYGGAIVQIKEDKKGEKWVKINQIPWDRIYFDSHSRDKLFHDSRWKGLMMWLYKDEVKEMIPGKDDLIDQVMHQDSGGDDTFEDRPRWIDKQADRLRLALHFEKYKATWHMSISVGDTFLIEPQVSPFLDDECEPTCPIELVAAYVDRQGDRYGETKHMLDGQDEINHRRSKFLHMLNSRQTYGRKGDAGDVKKLKSEMRKPDGHIEFEGDAFGKDFGVLPSDGAENGQFNLYLDSKAEMAATVGQANLQEANSQGGTLSGTAIARLQQSDTIEINRQYQRLRNWELNILRQVWGRIKQAWDEEKWLRIVDDQDALKWVGFNVPMTVQEILEEKINDKAEEPHVRKLSAHIYTQMVQNEDPRLQEVIETRYPVAELDVDLMLDQSFDTVNMQEEQFQMLSQFASSGDVDILDLIELSQLRGKDELIERIEKRREAAAQQQGGAEQMAAQQMAAKTESIQVGSAKTMEEAKQKAIESEMMLRNPDPSPQTII